MWTDEIIFSEGDLSNPENYLEELRKREEYTLNLRERQAHLMQIMKRISAEMKLIDKLIEDGFIITDSEIMAVEAYENERAFHYIGKHWDEYCKWCLEHEPEDFPIPKGESK